MKTAGQVLRTARESKGFSIDYVSETLKIRVKYLEAIENGDYSIFSSPIYIKGFLKNYAKLLDVSEEEVLALYRREYTSDKKKEPTDVFKLNKSVRTIPFALKPNHIIALTTIFIIGAILLYLFYEFRQFSAPPSLSISNPNDNSIVNSQTVVVDGYTNNSGNKVTINGQQIPNISANGAFSFPVTLHPQLNELIITATNSLNISTTIKRSIIYTNAAIDSTVTPTGTPTISSQMYGRVEISNDPTYVKIVIDGKSYFEGVLNPGSSKAFKANSTIYVDTGRQSDTNFSINGKNVSFTPAHQNAGGVEITATLNPDGTISFN